MCFCTGQTILHLNVLLYFSIVHYAHISMLTIFFTIVSAALIHVHHKVLPLSMFTLYAALVRVKALVPVHVYYAALVHVH